MTIADDGVVWTVGESGRLARHDPRTGEETAVTGCPEPQIIEPTADGSVYVGSFGWSPHGLYVIRGDRCQRLDPLGDGRSYQVFAVDSDQGGRVLAVLGDAGDGQSWTTHIALMTAGAWSVIDTTTRPGLPYLSSGDVAFGPDGAIWRSRDWGDGGGIERFDGTRWQSIVPGITALGSLSFGPDGSLWFEGPSGIHRIRAEVLAELVTASPQPSPAP
jgi:sugar lactone lactonase YvrE